MAEKRGSVPFSLGERIASQKNDKNVLYGFASEMKKNFRNLVQDTVGISGPRLTSSRDLAAWSQSRVNEKMIIEFLNFPF